MKDRYNIGKAHYKLIHSDTHNILAFIDELSWEEQYEEIPVLKLENERKLSAIIDKTDIVVTPIADFENTKQQIRKTYNTQEFNVFSIEEIL